MVVEAAQTGYDRTGGIGVLRVVVPVKADGRTLRVPGVEDAAQVFVIVCGLRAEYGVGLVEQERGRVVADRSDQRGGVLDAGPIPPRSVDGALGRLRLAVA